MFEDESDDFDDETEYGSNEEEEEESTKTTLNKMDADSKKSYYKYRRKAHEHKLYWNHRRKQYMPKLDDPNIVWPKKNPMKSSRKYYIKLALVSAKVTTIEEMDITIIMVKKNKKHKYIVTQLLRKKMWISIKEPKDKSSAHRLSYEIKTWNKKKDNPHEKYVGMLSLHTKICTFICGIVYIGYGICKFCTKLASSSSPGNMKGHAYAWHRKSIKNHPNPEAKEILMSVLKCDANGVCYDTQLTKKEPDQVQKTQRKISTNYGLPAKWGLELKRKVAIALLAMKSSDLSAELPEIEDMLQVLFFM